MFNVAFASIQDQVFTTFRPNFGIATYNDNQFNWLCQHFNPKSKSPSRFRVVDCPALIRDSSRGMGLGAELLVKHCGVSDALMIVVRAFGGDKCTQVGDGVNPIRDLDLILSELVNMDIMTLSLEVGQRKPLVERKQGGTQLAAELKALESIQSYITSSNKPLRLHHWNDQEVDIIKKLKFLTSKEVVVVVNMDTRDYVRSPEWHASPTGIIGRISQRLIKGHGLKDAVTIPYSGSFEENLRRLGSEEAVEHYFRANPSHRSSQVSLATSIFKALKMIHFFTCGKEEVRSWCLPKGYTAPEAARTIHRDFEEEFISVEVGSFLDLRELESEVELKREGKLTQQGRKYVVQDGDICFFKFKLPSYKTLK